MPPSPEARGNRYLLRDYRGHPGGSGHETRKHRVRYHPDVLRHLRLRTKRSAQWSRFHVRRPRGKFRHPGHIADHGKFDEAEPELKRRLHLGRERCQWRPGQGKDARQQSRRKAAQQAEQAGQNVARRLRLRLPVMSSRLSGDPGHDRSGWPAGRRRWSGFPAMRPPPGSRR